MIEERKAELDEARALLLTVKSRIDRGEPVDAETFCSLIRQGDKIMEAQDWKKVTDRYFSPEEQARWAKTMKDAPADFDQAEYSRKWKDLGDRVQAAIPLGPDRAEAQALYDEWQVLLAPFTAVATPEMMQGATRSLRADGRVAWRRAGCTVHARSFQVHSGDRTGAKGLLSSPRFRGEGGPA